MSPPPESHPLVIMMMIPTPFFKFMVTNAIGTELLCRFTHLPLPQSAEKLERAGNVTRVKKPSHKTKTRRRCLVMSSAFLLLSFRLFLLLN